MILIYLSYNIILKFIIFILLFLNLEILKAYMLYKFYLRIIDYIFNTIIFMVFFNFNLVNLIIHKNELNLLLHLV